MAGLPRQGRGRPSKEAGERYEREIIAFAKRIVEIRSGLDFAPSSRGWAYVLEGEGMITKGEFDGAQLLINQCRKNGTLPLNICSEDRRRAADGAERLDGDVDEELALWDRLLLGAPERYTPISFWDDQEVYVEIAVEKIDLKLLFRPVCAEYRIMIQNIAGWSDLHARAGMMERFAEHEAAGRRPILLYCGDHDPGGLHISDALRSNLEDMVGAVGWHPDNLIIDRFGLNYDDIVRLGLTWIDNLETGSGKSLADRHHSDHHKPYVQSYIRQFGARKCEANALIVRPGEAREMCRQAILKYLPGDAPSRYEESLTVPRAELREALVERYQLTKADQ